MPSVLSELVFCGIKKKVKYEIHRSCSVSHLRMCPGCAKMCIM